MPFNGSGTFVLPAGNPVVVNTTIDATVHNNTNNEIATALSNCVTRDGQSPPTASLPMGGFKLTGLGAGSGNGESVRYEQTTLKTIATGSAILPTGTTAQQDATPLFGYLRGNSTLSRLEWSNSIIWKGIVSLTGNAIDFINTAGTFTSNFTNANTAARTYTFQDKSGTVAHLDDISTNASAAITAKLYLNSNAGGL